MKVGLVNEPSYRSCDRAAGGHAGAARAVRDLPRHPEGVRLTRVGDDTAMGQLILLRHGETEWSASGRHTGRTEIPLTARGEAAAAALAPALARRGVRAPFTQPASRAVAPA